MQKFIYHESSRIVGGHCGFGSLPDYDFEQSLLDAGYVLRQEDEDVVSESGDTIQYRQWIAE